QTVTGQTFSKHARRERRGATVSQARGTAGVPQSSLARRMQRTDPEQRLPDPVPRQVLILIDQEQPQSLTTELARTYRLEPIRSERLALLGARAELMRVRPGQSQEAVLAALQRDTRVRSAQLNQRYLRGAGDAPISLKLAEADHLSRGRGDGRLQPSISQYAVRKLDLPDAHQLAVGRNVAIAIIDSAVDARHPDLQGAVARSFNAAGRADTAPQYHGTAVAGIIRAHGLVQGAAPGAEILAVRAFRTGGEIDGATTTTQILISAVDWAVRNGARVLNMSFIGTHDPALQQILSAANGKGVTVVAAAGNGGPTAPPVYPAAYPDVIAVTAVDERDQRYQHANRGSYIALAAPGVDILAPVEHGGYAYVSGTSFAAAYVSAIAALLLERDPSLDSKSILELLATGAEDLGPAGRDDDFGAGRVNAYSSLKLLANQLSAKRSDWVPR
ncbi:MAG: S8 family serine peptidase, partial [Hyphomicrobiaceae bacterium]|nr:S8 family serine peptidase [Hyphomicrobiaceae bacterium]